MRASAEFGLLNTIMIDGSRHFADLPESVSFDHIRKHAEDLAGSTAIKFITDGVTEMWLDFNYKGQSFSINNQFGSYWFFVQDQNCPNETLAAVVEYFRMLLDK